MKQKVFAVVVVLLLLVSLIIVTSYVVFSNVTVESQEPFYVGVTYCGSSVQEAKELVDKVKDYTNLFILQSGTFLHNITAIDEIGDYVIASNLNYAIYSGTHNQYITNSYLNEAKERWNKQFIGIYYNDEPGGNMLDSDGFFSFGDIEQQIDGTTRTVNVFTDRQQDTIRTSYFNNETLVTEETYYSPDGTISSTVSKGYLSGNVRYHSNGTITVTTSEKSVYTPENITKYPDYDQILQQKPSQNGMGYTSKPVGDGTVVYYSNGTITATTSKIEFYTPENITKYPYTIRPYEQTLKQKPLQTYDDVAHAYVSMNKGKLEAINKTQLSEESMLIFTSDYGLYWWDFQSGYDVIFAHLGWNHSDVQQVGLVRGAANLQGKSWGTILTWKYTHAPFLADGEEMFEQMKMSYEAGAEYVVIFNYSENPANPNTLQEEHFEALERFWNDVVQNPKVVHGSIKAEAAIVLPENYGWGMRNPYDTIWGMWSADNNSQEIWNQLQNKMEQYGLKLDIVFEDSNHPVTEKYDYIYYWDQK